MIRTIIISTFSTIVAFQLNTPINSFRRLAFLNPKNAVTSNTQAHDGSTKLFFEEREVDNMEVFAGGMRYEMVELPDSLVDTTCFVGNLDEFVTDEMLSILFQQVSSLQFIPACVARKPNASSLKHGFAIFPTVEEKEKAVICFNGFVLNGKPLRVESIIDYEFRVRVPEKLVCYTVGKVKRTRDGSNNTLRIAQNSRFQTDRKDRFKNGKHAFKSSRRKMTMASSSGNHKSSKLSGKRKKKEHRRRRRRSSSLGDTIF